MLTEDNSAEFAGISENNLNKIHNTISKVGYSDGITDGRDSVFQSGFDCGYEKGFLTGFELAKYKAFFEIVNKHEFEQNIHTEQNAYKNLEIPAATEKTHFQLRDEVATITEASRKQEDYIIQQQNTFAKEMPNVTSLFSS